MFKKIVIFIAGAVTGASAMYVTLRKSFDEQLDKEVKNLKEHYQEKANDLGAEIAENIVNEDDGENASEEISARLESVIRENGYVAYDQISPVEKVENPPHKEDAEAEDSDDDPDVEVIKPEEFDQFSDYGTRYLTYFRDKKLVDDETGEVIGNIDSLIGNSLSYIGFYEPDYVHVRNHAKKIDIEISKSNELWEGYEHD